jgi:ABC-2 type transport system permease protein
LLVGIVVPLGLAFIFNVVFSGAASGSIVISFGVVDQDGGASAAVFARDVLGEVAKGGAITVHPEADEALARSLVTDGTLKAAFIIPPGFSAAVQSNREATIDVIGNASAPISTEIARSIAEAYAAQLNRVRLSVATVVAGGAALGEPESIQALAARAAQADDPVGITNVSTATKELNAKSFYAAGMAVFFVFFTVEFGVTGLLEERANGTLARLVAAPVTRTAILAGKLLTSLVMGVVSMAVLVAATTLLFGASWGNSLGVGVLVIAAVLAAMGIMAVVATIAKTPEQSGNWQTVVAIVLGLLGGTFFPVAQAPGVLSTLTLVTPQAWFLRGLGDLRAGNLTAIWTPTLAMLAFAFVIGGVAISRLRRMAAF